MKKKKKNYFGPETDEAILRFQISKDPKEREMLCKEYILPAFEKLSSYWYHKVSVRKNEDSIHDSVAYLYEKINMFNAEKKTNGFSYFNTVARNFFFQKLKNESREVTQDQDNIVNISDVSVSENDSLIDEGIEISIENKEFIELFKKRLPIWRERTTKDQEQKILDTLIELFEDIDNIDLLDKKAVFFYLRERTGLKSKQIALNLIKFKKRYLKFKEHYQRGDV